MPRRVAVVGAGCSGLAAIKCCLEEDLLPTCFESASDIGGLWNFTEEVVDKRGSVMSSTIINTSKEMMAFSDFPAPKEFPNFMPHSKVLEYFRLYAGKFTLLQHIRFNTEVISIRKVDKVYRGKLEVSKQHTRNNVDAGPHCSNGNINAEPQCFSGNLNAGPPYSNDNINAGSHCSNDNINAESHCSNDNINARSHCSNDNINAGPHCSNDNINAGSHCSNDNINAGPLCSNDNINFGPQCCNDNINAGPLCSNDNINAGPICSNDNINARSHCSNDNINAGPLCSNDNINAGPLYSNDNINAGSHCSNDNINAGSHCSNDNINAGPLYSNDNINAGSHCSNDNINAGSHCSNDNINAGSHCSNDNINAGPLYSNDNINAGSHCSNDNINAGPQCFSDNTNPGFQCSNDNINAGSHCSNDNINAGSHCSNDNINAGSHCSNDNINAGSHCSNDNINAGSHCSNDNINAGPPYSNDNINAGPQCFSDNINPGFQCSNDNINPGFQCSNDNINPGFQCSNDNISAAPQCFGDSFGSCPQCPSNNIDAEFMNTAHCHTPDKSRKRSRFTNMYTNGDLDKFPAEDIQSLAVAQEETLSGYVSYPSLPVEQRVDNPEKINMEETAPPQPGQWEIWVKDKTKDSVTVHYFDFVLVCSGHHADISVPRFPGQSTFKGRIIHSRDLRRANEIAGSRHVVVGVGNSGCDAAVALSGTDKQVYLSTRRGTWLMQRLQKHGLPADIAYMSRAVFAIALRLPNWILNKCAEFHLNTAVDHTLYGLRPKHGPFATHPTVNDELPNKIACGHVIVKPNIDSFTERGVKFEDGTFADDIDAVVMATGYKIDYPFLDESIVGVKGNQCPLYLYMFPPVVTPPTMAVIGCVQAEGALVPVSEMQCRLAVRVFKNSAQLPSQWRMQQDITVRKRAMKTRYIQTQRHTIQVDFLPYMDELAALVGCQPRIDRLLFRDPRLALTCLFGPCTAYQYRLSGPHAWSGARHAIMTQMDRVKFPFCSRIVNEKATALPLYSSVITVNILFLALCIFFVHSFF